jgi:hypothetical protein
MTIQRTMVLIGCGALVVAIGARVFTHHPASRKEADAPGADGDAVPTANANDNEALQRRLRAMDRRLATVEARPLTEAIKQSNEAQKAAAPPPLTSSEAHALVESRIRKLDDALHVERVDQSWSGETEKALNKAFTEGNYKGTSILNFECRATMCRMEVAHDDEASRLAFEGIRDQQPMTYYLQPIDDSSGQRKTVAYFVRQGFDQDENHAFAQLWLAKQ